MEKGSDTRTSSVSPSLPAQEYFLKEFIRMYETCPSLWDPTNSNYLNRAQKNRDLDRLVKVYENLKPYATRDDVRKKVNTLRSNYRRELKKIEQSKRSGSGPDDVYRSKSSTFNLLKFLAKIERPVLTKEDSDYTCEEDDSFVFSSFANEEPPVKNKKIMKGAISKQNELELIPTACALLPQPLEPSQNISALAVVWSEKLNNLNPTQRLFAEKAINDILFKAELATLSPNIQINNFPSDSSPATSTHYLTSSPLGIQGQKNCNSIYATIPKTESHETDTAVTQDIQTSQVPEPVNFVKTSLLKLGYNESPF